MPITFIHIFVLLGTAALIHQKYAKKSLIQLLASLGFSLSYHEGRLRRFFKFQQLLTMSTLGTNESSDFCQYVFDNADHNVNTVDGLNTFHVMGRIMCNTLPVKNDSEDGIIYAKTKKTALHLSYIITFHIAASNIVQWSGAHFKKFISYE